jgi:hypothetical protein
MQGRTATFSTFSDAQFDEARFEAQLTGDRMTVMICHYWILKLKARSENAVRGAVFQFALPIQNE